jgi:hypothetical protein
MTDYEYDNGWELGFYGGGSEPVSDDDSAPSVPSAPSAPDITDLSDEEFEAYIYGVESDDDSATDTAEVIDHEA